MIITSLMKSYNLLNGETTTKKQKDEKKRKRKKSSNSFSTDDVDLEDKSEVKPIKKRKSLTENCEESQHLNYVDVNETCAQSSPSTGKDESEKKKKLKNRMYIKNKVERTSDLSSKTDLPIKIKKCLKTTNEEYKPGMLSNHLQVKKYDNLIIPWDSTFGLDPTYIIVKHQPIGDDKIKKKRLKINPLFDLSKRPQENESPLSSNTDDTVFVGNLPFTTKVGDLKKLFRRCGVIRSAKFRHKEFKNAKSSNKEDPYNEGLYVTAKVKFLKSESCKSALKMNGFLYEGRHLRVTLASIEGGPSDTDKSIFVGNLAFKVQDDELWKTFEGCGEIESVRVVRDGQSGKGKGFGYVNFKSPDSITPALKKNGTLILGREIRVERNSSNVHSLSDSVTVKRKKGKKRKNSRMKKGSTDLFTDDNESDTEKELKLENKKVSKSSKHSEHKKGNEVKKKKKSKKQKVTE